MIARRAEIDGEVELAHHAGKPLGHILRHAREQEIRRPQRLGAAAAGAQQSAIEDHGTRASSICVLPVTRYRRTPVERGRANR